MFWSEEPGYEFETRLVYRPLFVQFLCFKIAWNTKYISVMCKSDYSGNYVDDVI